MKNETIPVSDSAVKPEYEKPMVYLSYNPVTARGEYTITNYNTAGVEAVSGDNIGEGSKMMEEPEEIVDPY